MLELPRFPSFPTDPFTAYEPQSLSLDVSELHKVSRFPDLNILNCERAGRADISNLRGALPEFFSVHNLGLN